MMMMITMTQMIGTGACRCDNNDHENSVIKHNYFASLGIREADNDLITSMYNSVL